MVLLTFLFQTYCLLNNCFPTHPMVKVQRSERRSLIHELDTGKPPRVLTESGWVEGYFQKTITGRNVAAFEGIRYGEPPVGFLRFRDPQPAGPWSGIYKADKKAPYCLQLNYAQIMRLHGTEDCLFLNIFVPYSNDVQKLPVIFYIHGGAFLSGTSSEFGPAYLLNKDVILVTINYRLGILGFFSTGDEHAAGNWGLKDQVLALKWVKANIEKFGGDPDRITLAGTSAGAASVGLHYVSKQSQGLFQGGILESGSALTYWAITNETFHYSKRTAELMKCPTSSSSEMVDCLRNKDPNWVVGLSRHCWSLKQIMPPITRLLFGPVVEPSSPTAFLEELPKSTYVRGEASKVPMLIGWNKAEGVVVGALLLLLPGYQGLFNREWKTFIPQSLLFDNGTVESPEKVAKMVRDFYLGSDGLAKLSKRKELSEMYGDRALLQGIYANIQFHSKVAPTYAYEFSYIGNFSITSSIYLRPKDWGAIQWDEAIYLYNSSTNFDPLTVGTRDYEMSEFLVDLWVQFATTGNPTPNAKSPEEAWTPVSDPHNVMLLEVNTFPKMRKVSADVLRRLKFWQKLKLPEDNDFEDQ